MSFTSKVSTGTVYAPGWFLADNENCERRTATIKHDDEQAKTVENGGKYVPAGSIYPSNDGSAEGIVYEDVDVTSGDMPGSVVFKGSIYKDRLPSLESSAEEALKGNGFTFVEEAEIERPGA